MYSVHIKHNFDPVWEVMESLAATPVGRLEEVKQCRKDIKKKSNITFISSNR